MGILFTNCIICGCGFQNNKILDNMDLLNKLNKEWNGYTEFFEHQIEDSKSLTEKEKLKAKENIKVIKKYDWLTDLIAIVPNNIVKIKAIFGLKGDYYTFLDKNNNEYDIYTRDYKNKPYIMHNNCYKLLKNNNYNLSHESFLNIDLKNSTIGKKYVQNNNIEYNKFKINYGIVEKYYIEYDAFASYAAYGYDRYLLENPLKNKENCKRILKLKFPLKKEKLVKLVFKKDRPSPGESATLFKEGTKMKGNDGNMYVVVDKNGTKRWKKY